MKKFYKEFMATRKVNQAFCDEACFIIGKRRPKILVIDKDRKLTYVVQIMKED